MAEVQDSKTVEVSEKYAEMTVTQGAGHLQEELKGNEGTIPHPARLHAGGTTILRAQDLLVAHPTTEVAMGEQITQTNIDN